MKTSVRQYSYTRFEDLVQSVQHCDLCSRLNCRSKVLSLANGNIESKVLFVAEAPGRLGADITGIPLCGDRTGNNFEMFLSNIGWRREDIFITNAVLCNPRQENGNNATPTNEEIENCSAYLEMTISLIDPEVIVPLGITAITALKMIHQHDIQLSRDVARIVQWKHRFVFPMYHPGPRAIIHRTEMNQRSDYMILKKIIDPTKGLKNKKILSGTSKISSNLNNPTSQVACAFLSLFPNNQWVSQFKITKLMYLFDLEVKRKYGKTFACDIYTRQEYGPWPPHLYKILEQMNMYEITMQTRNKHKFLKLWHLPRFKIQIDEDIFTIILDIFHKYGTKSDMILRNVVYQTEPMKFILKQEHLGENFSNKPVLYKDKEAQEM
jgi:uracil-DNA glycosylase family 4